MIVIGDVHGCFQTLLALIAKLPPGEEIVFVGDLVDRGPRSADVIKFVRDNGYKTVMGNHEQLFYNAMNDGMFTSDFVRNGGEATIKSYGINFLSDEIRNCAQLQSDLEWIAQLPLYLEFPEVKNTDGRHLLVTHSSAHAVWHQKDQVMADGYRKFIFEQSLLWNRLPNIQSIDGIYNIFGHTVHTDNPRIKSCYANVDSGCCYPQYPEHGVLTAIQFPSMIVYQQKNLDMEVPQETSNEQK